MCDGFDNSILYGDLTRRVLRVVGRGPASALSSLPLATRRARSPNPSGPIPYPFSFLVEPVRFASPPLLAITAIQIRSLQVLTNFSEDLGA